MDYVKLDDVIDFIRKYPKAFIDDLAQAEIGCWIAERLERMVVKYTVYNKDKTVATHNQIFDRLNYAEEELECIDMFLDNLWVDIVNKWVWIPYSRIGRIKSYIEKVQK